MVLIVNYYNLLMGTKRAKKLFIALVSNLLWLSLFISNDFALGVSNNPTPVCVAGTCTLDFPYTGDYYMWSAPSTGVFTLQVWGAQGGNALNTNGTVAKTGPTGGYATGSISLTSGQSLYIYVGGQGSGSTGILASISGGFNGGGIGYNGDSSGRAASGGGGTDIRSTSNSLGNRVIVAGGGAGATYFTGYGTQSGGEGGGSSGINGSMSLYVDTTHNGKGGTQIAGGAGGQNGGIASSGTSGIGGNGLATNHQYGSSGGGGGYFGGGGAGVGMAAGGGSGYIGGVSSATTTAGNSSMPNPNGGTMTGRSGHGFARITYAISVDSTAPTFTSSSSFSAAENIATSANAATIKVSESSTVTISSGVDASLFNLITSDSVTVFIRFKTSPNYESPSDSGGNNVYDLVLTATDSASNAGTQTITITVTDVVDTSSFNSFTLSGAASFRTVVTITANVSVASRVTFRAKNVIIPGCKNRLTSGASPNIVATCSWRPAMRGEVVLTATASPTGAGISSATATPLSVMVGNRSGSR